MTAPSVRHSLIIHHPSRPLILLLRDGDGYALPTVVTDDRHTAEVDHINAAVRARFGITTIFLRSLFHADVTGADPVDRCHELAAHGSAISAGEWCSPRQTSATVPRAVSGRPRDGRGWERARWWTEATAWIRDRLRERRVTVTEVVQLRAWPSSSVLLVRSTGGDFYFKAVPHGLRRECAITAYLAEHFPRAVPAVSAVDLERRWLLMPSVGRRTLETIARCAPWAHAARRYGWLQMESLRHVDALRARGARERGLGYLTRRLAGLARAHPELRTLVPTLRANATRLAAYGIPPLLEHGDLWPGNFLVDGGGSTVIDWEEATIGHPFFSLAPFLTGMRICQPALARSGALERVLAAYLRAFAPFGTVAQLRPALDLAIPLAFCDMALRYSQQPPSMVRLHPWMRDLVGEAVGHAIQSCS